MYPMELGDSNLATQGRPDTLRERWLRWVSGTERAFWILSGFVFLLACVTRFWDLDAKAFHHDESLHAYYSYRVSTGSPHEYSALLHGPFLYYFVGAFLWVFGATDTTARMAAAVFSVALVMMPLLTKNLLGRAVTISLMILFLVSPTFWYFGRFLREDAFTSVWVLGTVLGGALFWKQHRPWALYFATAMLAFHFVNKENSYLHVFLWGLGMGAIALFQKRFAHGFEGDLPSGSLSPILDKKYLVINCASIFVTIFVLFYSSFFRHSKGSMHGILDGLYRESLLYWWDQNKKRRIDGPFDYHLPLIANYEFFVVPFLFCAWARAQKVARQAAVTFWNSKATIVLAVWALLATFLLPRVALVQDACSYTSFCLETVFPGLFRLVEPVARLAHLSHSRHVLQIVCYLLFGATAFFASLQLRRNLEAFLWFWCTGAIGVYSYVGEKVPWLLVYILIPLFLICGIEIGRVFSLRSGVLLRTANIHLNQHCASWSDRVFLPAIFWLCVALPFAVYKGWHVSFEAPDLPQERLVFTQTAPQAKALRDRWREARKKQPSGEFKIAMVGDATWPFAWYVNEFQAGDFTRPTAANLSKIDGLFLDTGELEKAKQEFPGFRIYKLSMRHWWVPGQNPSLKEILEYFFMRKLYPRIPGGSEQDNGVGDTQVLYLENPNSKVLSGLEKPNFMELLRE